LGSETDEKTSFYIQKSTIAWENIDIETQIAFQVWFNDELTRVKSYKIHLLVHQLHNTLMINVGKLKAV
jgi:hypothetical protein